MQLILPILIILVLFSLGFFFWLQSRRVRILISSSGEAQENQILQNLIRDFQKQNPDIQVDLEAIPYGEYNTRLFDESANRRAPDVIFVSSLNIADFYSRGFLEPLTPYVKTDPSVNLDAFYPGPIEWFTVTGNLYVLPRDIAPVCVIYYNKKAFDEAGLPYPKDDWTLDDFRECALKLTRTEMDGKVSRWGIVEDYPVPESWIYAFGGRFVDDSHHPARYLVDKPEFLKGVQFRADLIQKDKVMPGPHHLWEEGPTDLFLRGKAAMILSGIWKTPAFRTIQEFRWEIAPTPRAPWVPKAVIGGSSGYGIASSSRNKKAAWRLIAFLGGAAGQKEFASTGLIQPALMEVAESSAFLDHNVPRNKKFLLTAVTSALDDPLANDWPEIKRNVVYAELDKVWMGAESAEKAVAKLAEELRRRPLKLR